MNHGNRVPGAQAKVLRVGRWQIDRAACELRDGDTVIRLRPKVMDLLVVFARNPGEVLSKDCLLDLVWSDVTVGDASLSVAVAELRDAFGDQPDKPDYIETIQRRGYRLIASVSELQTGSEKTGSSHFWLTGAGLEFALRQGENLIGRAPDAHIRIQSAKVSRHHARITIDGDTAVVEDSGSKNGTFVDDKRVTGPTPLYHDNQLRLGQFAAILSIVVTDRGSTVTELSREVVVEPPGQ